ncbi:uncharacterized protein LOC143860537 isoform X2 [Tasmannia lanceolata]|uniref:uncharacterized protein LOC143860537 isoform X2 n=1 Tax=Tasmannia lanceolata TaxID=3420 RepID=UPI004063D7C2
MEEEMGEALSDMDYSTLVSAEDTIQALVDHLVLPLLPGKSSQQENPSLSQQELVAKQMHAAVLLYNYYHRKQCPELDFLDFESFCMVAANARASLLMHMKFMKRSNNDSGDLDEQFSITERMVMDACDICIGLNGQDSHSMKGWPVSKVAVFLIDSMKKNCLLQFGSITQGVWSLIEKDIDVSFHNLGGLPEKKSKNMNKRTTKGPTGDESLLDEAVLQQLAFSAVKENTGIDQTDLTILESHFVYSLSKEKSTARFYLIQCTKEINEEVTPLPITDVISSVRGPLVRKSLYTYEPTSVVEYFHFLPYVGVVSDWVSGKSSPVSSQKLQEKSGNVGEIISPNTGKPCTIGRSSGAVCRTKNTSNDSSLNLPGNLSVIKNEINNMQSIIPDLDLEHWKNSFIQNGSMAIEDGFKSNARSIPHKVSFPASSRNLQERPGNVREKFSLNTDQSCTMENNEISDKSERAGEIADIPVNELGSCKTEIVNKKENDHCYVGGSSGAVGRPISSSLNHPAKLSLSMNEIKIEKSTIPDMNLEHRKTAFIHNGSKDIENGFKDKMQMVDSTVKPHDTEMTGVKLPSGNYIRDNGVSVHGRMPISDLRMVPYERKSCDSETGLKCLSGNRTFDTGILVPGKMPRENDLLETSLRALQRKRDELYHQQRELEDEIARCERNLQTVRSGGDTDLMLKIVIEACNASFSNGATQSKDRLSLGCGEQRSQHAKRKRLSEAILNLSNPCQELDDICSENNWILPRYNVFPSNGGFLSTVAVLGVDFEYSVDGSLQSDPRDARELAATNMLRKLRGMASQTE